MNLVFNWWVSLMQCIIHLHSCSMKLSGLVLNFIEMQWFSVWKSNWNMWKNRFRKKNSFTCRQKQLILDLWMTTMDKLTACFHVLKTIGKKVGEFERIWLGIHCLLWMLLRWKGNQNVNLTCRFYKKSLYGLAWMDITGIEPSGKVV